jgi:prepilin-type N-terminal cleavage/methylation domain-containing protein
LKARPKAFTLIEFLLVIIISGILITAALPQLRRSFDNFRLTNFASELQVFMTFLRERAIVEGKIIYLNIDHENNKLLAQIKEAKEALKTLTLPRGLFLESEKKQILFYPDGRIDSVTVAAVNCDGQKITLTTKGVFGGVKILAQE